MTTLISAVSRAALVAALLVAGSDLHACTAGNLSRERLVALRTAKFSLPDGTERTRVAVGLVDCLGDPDPAIRDGIAFEGISTWLRGKQLDSATVVTLYQKLTRSVAAPPDAPGFRRPFAILVLSEVARADRITPTLSPAQFDSLVNLAAQWMRGVDDYRGYVDGEGWRHGIAHGADLVLQLELNQRISAEQLRRLIDAVETKVAPAGKAALIHTEPERLARAVFFGYGRGLLDETYWQQWFNQVASPAPLKAWSDAWQGQAGLAQRHNTLDFLYSLHFLALSSRDARGEALATLARGAITSALDG